MKLIFISKLEPRQKSLIYSFILIFFQLQASKNRWPRKMGTAGPPIRKNNRKLTNTHLTPTRTSNHTVTQLKSRLISESIIAKRSMGQSKHTRALLTDDHPFQVSPQSTSLMPSSHSISLGNSSSFSKVSVVGVVVEVEVVVVVVAVAIEGGFDHGCGFQ